MANATVAQVQKAIRKPGREVKNNIYIILPMINYLLEQYPGMNTDEMFCMCIATINTEVPKFWPIGEYKSRYNTDPGGRAYGKYDFRTDIGNNAEGDGARYKGRGIIQLTGKYNYEKYGPRIGVDLIADPEMANSPFYAVKIMIEFLFDKKDRTYEAIAEGNLAQARKLVNGGRHGLDTFVDTYNRMSRLLTVG